MQCGKISNPQMAPKCINSSKNSKISRTTSNTRISLALATSSKNKVLWTKRRKGYNKESSWKEDLKSSQSRKNTYKHKYQKEQSKKKYFGNKNQELYGLKRVKETQSSFIALLSNEECTTTSLTSRIGKGSSWKNMRM